MTYNFSIVPPLYHPPTNGLAERAVQTTKHGVCQIGGESVEDKLSRFLLKYRITPHSTTGTTPSELLMDRKLRSRLDLLFPDLQKTVEDKQWKQKQAHDNMKQIRSFREGDQVFSEHFASKNKKWTPGVIQQVTGPVSYQIRRLEDGRVVRRHVDNVQLRIVIVTNEASENEKDTVDNDQESWEQFIPTSSTVVTTTTSASGSSVPEASPTGPPPPSVTTSSGDVNVAGAPLRRSTRQRPPPDRYGFGSHKLRRGKL